MSQALSVEKTSKRGGRIVHEKDRILLPPPLNPNNQFGESFKIPSQEDIPNMNNSNQSNLTPPSLSQCEEGNQSSANIDNQTEYGGLGSNSGEANEYGSQTSEPTTKPSITELMKNPSKVVLCKVSNRWTINNINDESWYCKSRWYWQVNINLNN